MHPNNSRYTKSAHRTTLTSYTNNNTTEHTTHTHNGEGTERSGALGQMKWNRKLFATARKQINTWSFSCAFAFAARNYAVVVHFSMPFALVVSAFIEIVAKIENNRVSGTNSTSWIFWREEHRSRVFAPKRFSWMLHACTESQESLSCIATSKITLIFVFAFYHLGGAPVRNNIIYYSLIRCAFSGTLAILNSFCSYFYRKLDILHISIRNFLHILIWSDRDCRDCRDWMPY